MEGKDLLATRRFWGAVLTVFGPLLSNYFSLSPAGYDGLAEALSGLAGAAIAVWGYFKRDEPITTVGGLPIKDSGRLGMLLAVVLALALSACTSIFQAPKNPQDALNEGRVYLIAIARTVESNVRSGVMSLNERDAVMAEWDKYREGIASAQALLDAGKGLEAQQRAQILNTAIIALHRKIAAKAKGAHNDRMGDSRGRVALGGIGHERGSGAGAVSDRAGRWLTRERNTGLSGRIG